MMRQTEELLLGMALRGVAERYALAADTGDGDLFAEQFTPDGVLEAPRGRFEGYASLATVPLLLRERYVETFHAVHNQVVQLSGDRAQAVTYCIARHFWNSGSGEFLCYEMTIRYLDSFVKEKEQWRLALRKLVVVGTRTFPVEAARSFAAEE